MWVSIDAEPPDSREVDQPQPVRRDRRESRSTRSGGLSAFSSAPVVMNSRPRRTPRSPAWRINPFCNAGPGGPRGTGDARLCGRRRRPRPASWSLRTRTTSSSSSASRRQVFKLDRVRPAVVAEGLAELQVCWPAVLVAFTETRRLAEEWTYPYLAAAHAWAETEAAVTQPLHVPANDSKQEPRTRDEPDTAPSLELSTAQVRAWSRSAGHAVFDHGRLHTEVWQAWRDAHDATGR